MRLEQKRNKRRLIRVIEILIVVIGIGFLALALVEKSQSRGFGSAYEKQQDYYAQALAAQLEILSDGQPTEEKLLEVIESPVIQKREQWSVLFRGEQLIGSYNTELMQEENHQSVEEWKQALEAEGYLVTMRTFMSRGTEYTLGLVTCQQMIQEEALEAEKTAYFFLIFGAISVLFFVAVVYLASERQKGRVKVQGLQKRIVEKNCTIENLKENQLELARGEKEQGPEETPGKRTFYDREFLMILLEKSDRKELGPCSILYIKFEFGTKYYTKEQIHEYAQSIHQCLDKRCVFVEIAKGEYTILTYRCGKEEVEKLIQKLHEVLSSKIEGLDLSYKILKNYEQEEPLTVKERFELLYLQ